MGGGTRWEDRKDTFELCILKIENFHLTDTAGWEITVEALYSWTLLQAKILKWKEHFLYLSHPGLEHISVLSEVCFSHWKHGEVQGISFVTKEHKDLYSFG